VLDDERTLPRSGVSHEVSDRVQDEAARRAGSRARNGGDAGKGFRHPGIARGAFRRRGDRRHFVAADPIRHLDLPAEGLHGRARQVPDHRPLSVRANDPSALAHAFPEQRHERLPVQIPNGRPRVHPAQDEKPDR
jgi:hypothetical protein